MSGEFSGIVRITNASDYIAPSQACILPFKHATTEVESKVTLRRKGPPVNDSEATKKKVTVSLNDCLACNGCVTSAESVLIQEQSTSKLTEGLASSSLSVVTISPQSLCSIGVKRGLRASEAAMLLAAKFKALGATFVVDSSFARYLSLSASYEEFKERRHEGIILSSICPGFVCYAEKVHGKLLIPYVSRVRSPQAIMGALVKDYLSRLKSALPENIFHATVMPCFDKKLEASRAEFNTGFRQVDCVISTGEADSLLDEVSVPTTSFVGEGSERLDWLTSFQNGVIIGTPGGASGGYAEYIVQRFLIEMGLNEDNVRRLKSQKDLEVIEVFDKERTLLIVAKCYGFRNIQNLVQKLKRGKSSYSYVEVMACPSGCANGGGQIRGDTTENRLSKLDAVIEEYSSLESIREMEDELERVKEEWQRLNADWKSWLFTDFHIVDKNVLQSRSLNW